MMKIEIELPELIDCRIPSNVIKLLQVVLLDFDFI